MFRLINATSGMMFNVQKSFIEYTDSMLGEIVFLFELKLKYFPFQGGVEEELQGERLFKILHEKMF